jgi:hypothetical protein
MMSRKRPVSAVSTCPIDQTTSLSLSSSPPPFQRIRGHRHYDVLTCEVETLTAELQHERSLRDLDAKRFVQEKHRLQQQLEFALEESRDVQTLMKETIQKNDRYVEQLKKARLRVQEELRQVQDVLAEERAMAAETAATTATLKVDPQQQTLQLQLQAKEKENTMLKSVIATLQDQLDRHLERVATAVSTDTASTTTTATTTATTALPFHQLEATTSTNITTTGSQQQQTLFESRPETMKELSRVRMLLAESERKNRHYHRMVEEVSQKSKQILQERERLRTAKKRIEQLQMDLAEQIKLGEMTAAELQQVQSEHKIMGEKFGKLREAVYTERTKAEQAVQRANQAEALAGKGSFDPEKTRVMHLVHNNPLMEALKGEIKVLKRQVEVLSGNNDSNSSKNKTKKSPILDVDPNKFHQRLKQSFKEQIGRFREGVYLMTGYKVRKDW